MKNHMDKHIGKMRLFYCDKCDFRNKNKLVLRHHETLNHGIEATVLCDLCDFNSENDVDMKRHTRDKHDILTKSTSPQPKKKRRDEPKD